MKLEWNGLMENIGYKIKVERFNRLEIFLLICSISWLAYGISYGVEENWGIIVRGEAILLALLVLVCVIMIKLESYFPLVIELDVEFGTEEVTFQRGKIKRKLVYKKICEVEKMMIINRYHSEKGYYRVKVKTKGRPYVIYSGEESTKALDFDETDVSKVYYEFKRRGVKCC